MRTETDTASSRIPLTMGLPAVLLLIVGLAVAIAPSSRAIIERQTDRFRNGVAYQSVVLDGQEAGEVHVSSVPKAHVTGLTCISLAATLMLAGLTLFPKRLGRDANRRIGHLVIRAMRPLRLLQSGRIGDYIAWLVLGIAGYGALLLILERTP